MTVRGYVRTIKRFFNWLCDEGRLTENPGKRLKLPKKPKLIPRAIAQDDFDKMLAAAQYSRDRALLLMLRDTGCRAGELCGLRIKDVDLEHGIAFVLGKGNQERFVFMKEKTREAIRNWLSDRGACAGEDRLFVSHAGDFKRTTVYQTLKRIAGRAGVQGRFNPHSVRHGFGRDYVLSGGDVSSLADLLGHSDIETTKVYLRFKVAELQRLHDQHSPVLD